MDDKLPPRLRSYLARKLRQQSGDPKDAAPGTPSGAAMSRRDFLRTSRIVTAGALTTTSLFPAGCGRSDGPGDETDDGGPHPVPGPGPGAQAPSNLATHLSTSTELFQDTIYAQAVVSPQEPNTHALVEGARGRPRIQSDFASEAPGEAAFLDTQYHIGPAELVQLEQTGGQWELVHYYHPWGPTHDSGRTTGLVRNVIMTQADGLVSPTKLIAVTGSYTNRVSSGGSSQQSGISYAIFVEQSSGGHYLVVGVGGATVPAPYDELPFYPVHWVSRPMSTFDIPQLGALLSCDKYTNNAWRSDLEAGELAQYDPRQAVEHILLYYQNYMVVLTLEDIGQTGTWGLGVARIPYPNPTAPTDGRIVHIDWDPTLSGTSDWRRLMNVVVNQTTVNSDGSLTYYTYGLNRTGNSDAGNQLPFGGNVFYTLVTFHDAWGESAVHVSASQLSANPDLHVDYSMLRSVHGLYDVVIGGNYYHLKLANVAGHGLFAINVMKTGPPDTVVTPQDFALQGHFRLALPDANGLGEILSLSGGTSKFGGLRFVTFDANGNLFMSRQRGASTQGAMYEPPIYGLYDTTGAPIDSVHSAPDPLPSGIAATSNLHELTEWMSASVDPNTASFTYNLMLQCVLAFGTDDSCQAQGVWLGNGYQGAYALKRFGLDSEHVVIRKVQGSDGSDQFSAISMFKNPVDKTWRKRVIATQVVPQDPGENETGDHYQATITLVNSEGKPVSVLDPVNANLTIEVRADSPCTVTDDTHNLYYDVDRYTSFFADPDPGSGRLNLVVKADVLSQVLYVRLVDSTRLEQQGTDKALLTGPSDAVTPWQSVNLAAQAQQRMGNSDAAPSADPDGDAPPDATTYVSTDTLAQSNTDTPWQTKGSYSPSNSNLGNLATYLNCSAQNMFAVTGQLSDAGDGDAIDPLTSVSAIPVDENRPTVTTNFDYAGGHVTTTQGELALPAVGGLGGVLGSLSHALHDALHWLQHTEGQIYHELGSGGVTLVSSVDGVVVTVAADIMKQVNGVETELQQVVTTVEEYASVVVDTVVTIVEESFIYEFVELLIALVSMFLYFGDILDLSKSFKQRLDDFYSKGSFPQVPASFSSEEILAPFLGPDTTLASSLSGVDSSQVESEVTAGILDLVSGNPLARKILDKVLGAIAQTTLDPLSFSMDQSAVQELVDEVAQLETSCVEALEAVTEDTVETLVDDVAGAASNPREFYEHLASDLAPVAAEIVPDALSPFFDFFDSVATTTPDYAHDVLEYGDYLTLKIPMLSDLCQLFGIGSVSGSRVKLSTHEAVFFPLAMIVWVAVYQKTGSSIKSVDALDGTLQLGLEGSEQTLWDFARLSADFVLAELGGSLWAAGALTDTSSSEGQSLAANLSAAGAWVNLIRWTHELVYATEFWDATQDKPYDFAYLLVRLATACVDAGVTLPGQGLNPGEGWLSSPRPTDITQAVNALATLGAIGYDTSQTTADADAILGAVGQDLARSQILGSFLFNLMQRPSELVEVFGVWILAAPLGFVVQQEAL